MNGLNLSQINFGQLLQMSENMSAASLAVQVQMLVAEEFTEQLQDIGQKIEFLNDIKKSHRKNINTLRNFMSGSPNSSRNDGKRYFEASMAQMATLTGAMVSYDYNLEKQTSWETPITFADTGNTHQADDEFVTISSNDTSTAEDWNQYFTAGAALEGEEAIAHAQKLGNDDQSLPFYYGHMNNQYEDGSAKFAVYEDSLERVVEQINNTMSDVESESEELGTQLNALVSQRKASIDSVREFIQEMDEAKKNAISKMDS